MKETESFAEIKKELEKMKVLSELFEDLAKKNYANKEDRDIGKLKMALIKKEMALLSFVVDKETEKLSPR